MRQFGTTFAQCRKGILGLPALAHASGIRSAARKAVNAFG
jgi:hypothetical protein